jgi:phosphatidylserine/phosphatidylglycerophosphate/cardiolipin synthase-like enzyme
MAKELVNDSALQRIYQSVLEENENGVEVEIKMQATKEFRAKLNDLVFEAISFSINHARRAGHQMLVVEDLPMLVEATECTSAQEDEATEDAASI